MNTNEYEETARVEDTAKEWMNKYGKYIETNPVIDFNGTNFVFTGLTGHSTEKNHPTVQKVIERGGQYRQKVSGTTNYLVVNPEEAGETKIEAVIEQLEKGKNIKVILLKNLEKKLKAKTPSKKAAESKNAAKTLAAKNAKENSGVDGSRYALVGSERKSYKAVKAEVLKTGKTYTYFTRSPLKVGDKALIGFYGFTPSLNESSEDAYFCLAKTSKNIATVVDLNGNKTPKAYRVVLDLGFTKNVTKKIINDCAKFMNIEESDLILISTRIDHVNDSDCFRPISRFVRRIIAAATVLAFKEYASKESISRANEILATRHSFPMQIFDAESFFADGHTLELEDVYMKPDYESIEALKEKYGELIDKSWWREDDDDETPPLYHLYIDRDDDKDEIDKIGYDALDEYINKSVFTSAMAVMIQADLKNLMEAFLSANPPIDDYLDYMIEYANSLGAVEYVEMLKKVKK